MFGISLEVLSWFQTFLILFFSSQDIQISILAGIEIFRKFWRKKSETILRHKRSNFVFQKVLSVGQVLLSISGQELLYQKTAHEDDPDLEYSNHFFRWALHNSAGLLLVSKVIAEKLPSPKLLPNNTFFKNFDFRN